MPNPVAAAFVILATTQPSLFILPAGIVPTSPHHTHHAELFSRYAPGQNALVLAAVDKVQATAPDGGGYFIGVRAKPAESPIGYELKLFGQSLLSPPRTTSYCSGSSYTAFIESLNLMLPGGAATISPDRIESLRMQEPDGSRREDGVKFWGHWNEDGFGTLFALVQYSHMGTVVSPAEARPGDFANISWTSGLGHSVVFLGFFQDPRTHEKRILYWSSQKGTNGLGDQSSPISKVKDIKFVRLTHPENVFTFDPNAKVSRGVPGDRIEW
ncbi:MAG TPA: hypothetical protein VFE58_00385 [Tepidisphaeraceae bacterium]|jgi:hypothetical protein|nr:hypothetical protein [Tepidisphaeraceae bacterium]